MSFKTANCANVISKRDYHEIYVLMSLCLFKTANCANVISNREYHEIYVLMFLCLL